MNGRKLCFFATLATAGLVALAQSLPRLNVNSSGNHQVIVAWPYTNAGFIFQEANWLSSATDWHTSVLVPVFDSNKVGFSVSTPTTNAVNFFRLARPADLRGIYVNTPLAGGPNNPSSAPVTNALQVPGVDGMLITGMWSELETNYNQYDWSHLDKWMSFAAAQNKKVNLVLRAGDGIPAWLFLAPTNGPGATKLVFGISPKDGNTGICQTNVITIPWAPGFLNSWNDYLSNLSAHLKATGAYSNVTLVRLTGINRTSDELRLPAETPYTNGVNGTGLPCVSDAPAMWQTNGYTPAKLLQAWSNIVASFNASFPDKTFCVAIIPYPPQLPFPPIDDSGDQIPITNTIPDQNAPLLQLAGQMLPGRLVAQFNFLISSNTANPAVAAAAVNYGAMTAFQANNWLARSNNTGCSACGGVVTAPIACTDATYLQLLQQGIYPLGPTNPLRSQYLEVWATNVISFTNAIWQAHLELFAP